MTFFIVVVMLCIVAFGAEKAVRFLFRVPKKQGWRYQYVNERQRWTEWGIITVVLLGGIMVLFAFPQINTAFLLLAFYFLLFGTRAWFEWKYDCQSRQYMMSICTIVFIALLLGLLNGPLPLIFE